MRSATFSLIFPCFIFTLIVICMGLLVPYLIPVDSASSIDEVDTFEELAFIEEVASSGGFSYCRDSVTDVMYLFCKRGYSGGLTVMLDPVTGLPLTYSRYIELFDLISIE